MKAEEMFRSYAAKKQEVDLLKFRITNFRGIDADEVIKSMCLAKPEGEKVQEGETSDRTASVALNYRKTADRLEDEMFDGLLEQYSDRDVLCAADEIETDRSMQRVRRDCFIFVLHDTNAHSG